MKKHKHSCPFESAKKAPHGKKSGRKGFVIGLMH